MHRSSIDWHRQNLSVRPSKWHQRTSSWGSGHMTWYAQPLPPLHPVLPPEPSSPPMVGAGVSSIGPSSPLVGAGVSGIGLVDPVLPRLLTRLRCPGMFRRTRGRAVLRRVTGAGRSKAGRTVLLESGSKANRIACRTGIWIKSRKPCLATRPLPTRLCACEDHLRSDVRVDALGGGCMCTRIHVYG